MFPRDVFQGSGMGVLNPQPHDDNDDVAVIAAAVLDRALVDEYAVPLHGGTAGGLPVIPPPTLLGNEPPRCVIRHAAHSVPINRRREPSGPRPTG